jgi:alkylhydroperoxidase/carboxymuconolactone decarboxylase family protein YurZ
MVTFHREAPEIAKAYDGLIQSLIASPALDTKTKQLIYISLKASQGDISALQFHVPMAKNLGATAEEVKEAILLTLTVTGLTGVVTCLQEALKVFDEKANENIPVVMIAGRG